MDRRLPGVLRCPRCLGRLEFDPGFTRCQECQTEYPILAGRPILLLDSHVSLTGGATAEATSNPEHRYPKIRLPTLAHFPEQETLWKDFISRFGARGLVLNLGSGSARLACSVINLDIDPNPDVDVVADVHRVPLADESVDGIIAVALLEHVENPRRIATEIHRVLRPGGGIFVDVPFIQPYHPSPTDYQRFTRDGLAKLFENFEEVNVRIGAGPASALAYHLAELFGSFSDRFIIHAAWKALGTWLFLPIRYLDIFLRHKVYAERVAMNFVLTAKKQGSDVQIAPRDGSKAGSEVPAPNAAWRRHRALNVFAAILCFSGINLLWRWLNRKKARILLYHGVAENSVNAVINVGGRQIRRKAFGRHVRYLSRKYKTITMDELVERMEKRAEFPPNTVLLTFDDGYLNNARYAYPILKENRIPAIVFLTTQYIDRPDLAWFDRLEMLLARAGKSRVTIRAGGEEKSIELVGDLREGLRAARTWLGSLGETAREKAIEELEAKFGAVNDPVVQRNFELLTWRDVCDLDREGLLSFGAHSTRHQLISDLNEAAFQRDAEEARRTIENRLKGKVVHYSYPLGRYEANTVAILKRCGYRSAVTTRHGFVTQDSDPFLLNRMGIQDELGYFTFCCAVSGLLGALMRLRRWIMGSDRSE